MNREDIQEVIDLDSAIVTCGIAIALNIMAMLGVACLLFLDMTPVLRIIWMVIIFGYLGFLFIGSIIKFVKLLKTKKGTK